MNDEKNTKERSTYREILGKQLAFLETAQKDVIESEAFSMVTCYSREILNLAKEIDRLDGE